jgi:hypothetical protein
VGEAITSARYSPSPDINYLENIEIQKTLNINALEQFMKGLNSIGDENEPLLPTLSKEDNPSESKEQIVIVSIVDISTFDTANEVEKENLDQEIIKNGEYIFEADSYKRYVERKYTTVVDLSGPGSLLSNERGIICDKDYYSPELVDVKEIEKLKGGMLEWGL